jgi:hypothetical protein
MFKKFLDFVVEGRIKTSQLAEEIPDVELETAKSVSDDKCPKCGSTQVPCLCYTDDYYDSKTPQQAPKPTKTKKGNPKDEQIK